MTATKADNKIQVIDRAAMLLDAISRYSTPVKLKVLSAETGLHSSTAHRILRSLIDNRFVERDMKGEYMLGQRLQQLSGRMNSDVDLRAVAVPYMEQLRDKLGETVNLTVREGDALIYFEKATPNLMMYVRQIIGGRAPLHVTAVGKLMLGYGGLEEIASYAERTNLPAYTRNTLSSLDRLSEECLASAERGYGLDNEEAEIGVGCIGILLNDRNGNIVAGLSVSAPIDRRRNEWIEEIALVGEKISAELGYQ